MADLFHPSSWALFLLTLLSLLPFVAMPAQDVGSVDTTLQSSEELDSTGAASDAYLEEIATAIDTGIELESPLASSESASKGELDGVETASDTPLEEEPPLAVVEGESSNELEEIATAFDMGAAPDPPPASSESASSDALDSVETASGTPLEEEPPLAVVEGESSNELEEVATAIDADIELESPLTSSESASKGELDGVETASDTPLEEEPPLAVVEGESRNELEEVATAFDMGAAPDPPPASSESASRGELDGLELLLEAPSEEIVASTDTQIPHSPLTHDSIYPEEKPELFTTAIHLKSESQALPVDNPRSSSLKGIFTFVGSAALGIAAGTISGLSSGSRGEAGPPGANGSPGLRGEDGLQGEPGIPGERGLSGPVIDNSLILTFKTNDRLEGWETACKISSHITWIASVKPPVGSSKELSRILKSENGLEMEDNIVFERNSLLGNYTLEIKIIEWKGKFYRPLILGRLILETDPPTSSKTLEIGPWEPSLPRQWCISIERDGNP